MKFSRILLILIGAILITESNKAQSWQQCQSMPEALSPNYVKLNSKIYVAGSGKMYIYDLASDTWVTGGEANAVIGPLVEVNGRIFGIGGRTSANASLKTVYEYEISTNTWQNRHSTPLPCDDAGLLVYQGKIYVIGGTDNAVQAAMDDVQVYNPENDIWETKAKMNKQRIGPAVVCIDDKIYAICGWARGYKAVGGVEVYDPVSDSWTLKSDYAMRGHCQSVALNGKIYSVADSFIIEYDPVIDTWTKKLQTEPIDYFTKLVVDNKLYMFGGWKSSGMTNKVIRYNPSSNTEIFLPELSEKKAACGAVEYNGKVFTLGGCLSWNGTNIKRVEVLDISKLSSNLHPYASEQPMPMPVHFNIPGSIQAWHITFEPDGNTFYYLADSAGFYEIIKSSHFENGAWSFPQLTKFSGIVHEETPFVSPDGKKFFFAKNFTSGSLDNENIFMMEKTDSGWSDPVDLGAPVNSSAFDASPSCAANGNLYFFSQRSGLLKIYRAVWNGSGYNNPELVGNTINRFSVAELYIAPDESYILFGRNMSGTNWGDIYISFRNNDTWTLAKSLGPKINTLVWEGRPCVSPDGNYLFFSRGGEWTENPWQIYQVDWKPLLDSLRSVSFPTGIENEKSDSVLPGETFLEQNYPNPFNPETEISYKLQTPDYVQVKIFDALGREVITLVNKVQEAGYHSIKFDGSNIGSGIYFYLLNTSYFRQIRKMICLK